jgi:hypothetical protein
MNVVILPGVAVTVIPVVAFSILYSTPCIVSIEKLLEEAVDAELVMGERVNVMMSPMFT